MSRNSKLFSKLEQNPAGAAFRELRRAAEALGFVLEHVRGSHHRLRHQQVRGLRLNLQPDGKMAKAYQVKQLLEIRREYNLSDE